MVAPERVSAAYISKLSASSSGSEKACPRDTVRVVSTVVDRSARLSPTAGAPFRSDANRSATASSAMTIPAPESRSTPSASMSSALLAMPASSSARVTFSGPLAASSISAPMAAACDAAGEVPQ